MSNMPTSQEVAFSDDKSNQNMPRLGTVVALFSSPAGTAQIRFEGEEDPSDRQYPYLASYKPVVNDRVLLLPIAGTYIIVGKVLYNTAPPSASSLTLTSLTVTDSFNHSGGWLGFFGKGSVTNKTSVADPTAIQTTETAPSTYTSTAQNMLTHLKTDVTNLQTKLKSLLDALQSYNLV
jgi:hypothetical protein